MARLYHYKKENRVVAAARLRKVRATQSTILPNGKARVSVTDSATERIPPASAGKGENVR